MAAEAPPSVRMPRTAHHRDRVTVGFGAGFLASKYVDRPASVISTPATQKQAR